MGKHDEELFLLTDSTTATMSDKERDRIQNLMEYDLNYEFNDEELQSIAKLASFITGLPQAYVTIVGVKYTNFLTSVGSDVQGAPREMTFCNYCIQQDNFFELKDTLVDERSKDSTYIKCVPNPLRYYGGWPLKSKEGYNLGSICVCSMEPFEMAEDHKIALKTLADQVMTQFQLKRQNRLLSAAKLKAEKLSKIKDDFISNISHELRTPLNAINGYAEILGKSKLDPDQQEAVSIIQNSSEILITLVNDILDFSKINSEKLALEKIPFSLEKTVKLVYDLLLKKAEQKNIHLVNIFDEKIPKKIMGDKIRINQIIMNLAGNAIKFTEKGSVTIEVKLLEESEKDLILYFSVRDTGIGIPRDKLDKIFERFEQAGTEITRKFGGTGLGLNISKNLVELHDGKLEVKSIYGEGSEFFFSIKFDKFTLNNEVQQELMVDQLKSKNIIKSNLEKLRVLICEDNSVNIKLINHMFKGKVTHLEIAENGKVAIEILKRKMFDVILMDVHMPDMDGLETTKYIRNTLKLNVPIIGFTATSSQAEKEMCLEVGMNDCITKSFLSEEVFHNMCSVVSLNKVYKEDLLAEENNFYLKRRSNKLLTKSQKYDSKLNLNKIYSEQHKNRQSLEKKISLSSNKLNFASTYKNNNSLFDSRKNSLSSSNSIVKHVSRKNSIKLTEKSPYLNSSKILNRKLSRKFSYKKNEYTENSKLNEEEQKNNQNSIKIQFLNNNITSSSDDSSEELISDRQKNIVIINSYDEEEHNDYVQFDLLKEFSGDDVNLENDIIELFLKNIPIEIDTLMHEILTENLKEVKFRIHKMKNSLEIFGLRIIIEKMEKIQNFCELNKYNYALEIFHGIKNDMYNIYNELNKKLENFSIY
jgi:signal transduction histidine kinase/DNA-binding response OmpR family regulator